METAHNPHQWDGSSAEPDPDAQKLGCAPLIAIAIGAWVAIGFLGYGIGSLLRSVLT